MIIAPRVLDLFGRVEFNESRVIFQLLRNLRSLVCTFSKSVHYSFEENGTNNDDGPKFSRLRAIIDALRVPDLIGAGSYLMNSFRNFPASRGAFDIISSSRLSQFSGFRSRESRCSSSVLMNQIGIEKR